jgi:hypothetical protein
MTSQNPARPRVLVNFASSVDGKINPAPGLRHGKFMMSRHREDFRRMVSLRAEADAILIGASNLRADNPDLAIPPDEHAARQARGAADPTRIVLTSNGDGISPDMRMFAPARGRVQLGLRRGGGGPARPRDVDREIIAVQSTLAKYHPPVSPAPSHLDDPSGASGRAAAILLASCVAFALALSCLAFHYLRLSEAYARLLWS